MGMRAGNVIRFFSRLFISCSLPYTGGAYGGGAFSV